MKRIRPPNALVYFSSPRELKTVKAAAARAKLSVSAFMARAALDNASSDSLTAKLLDAPAFRGAIADMMSRPAVVSELAERLKVSSPAQLELFRREMSRGLRAAGKGYGG